MAPRKKKNSAPSANTDATPPDEAADDEEDIIAALDAKAAEIGDMLESRIDEIDSHWQKTGAHKPGAVAKSGATPKPPSSGVDGGDTEGDDLIAALDAQGVEIGEMLESQINQIDEHWRHSEASKSGELANSGATPKVGSDGVGGDTEGDDLIAALDAQAAEIGEMLESRIDEIDAHWRHSGGTKPGAVPKSGVQAKAKAPEPTGLGSTALGAAPKAAWNTAVGVDPNAVGSIAKGSLPPPPPPPAGVPKSIAKKIPFKGPPSAPPKSASITGEDEDDYDPFTELPTPQVAAREKSASLLPPGAMGKAAPPGAMGKASVAIPSPAELNQVLQAAQAASNQSLLALQAMQTQLLAPPAKGAIVSTLPWGQVGPQAGLVMPASGVSLADLKANGDQKENIPQAIEPSICQQPEINQDPSGATAPSAAADAQKWLKRGGVSRVDAGAQLAKEYFTKSTDAEAPPSKRQKVEKSYSFSPELLEKAPSSIQTCRSLLLFLDKKLDAPAKKMPDVGGPADLRSGLEAYADGTGWLAGLKSCSWDARAKRVLDTGATVASSSGQTLLATTGEKLESAKATLEKQLKERGEEGVETLTKERIEYAKDNVRLAWLSWCACLLRQREGMLLKDGGEATDSAKQDSALGPLSIVEALLKGESPLQSSKDAG